MHWWKAEQHVQKHTQSGDFPSEQWRSAPLGPSFPRHSYHLGLSRGDLGHIHSFSFAVSPLLTASTEPPLARMRHPLLMTTPYCECTQPLGNPRKEASQAFRLCTETNPPEVHVVNLAPILEHGPRDSDTRTVHLLRVF